MSDDRSQAFKTLNFNGLFLYKRVVRREEGGPTPPSRKTQASSLKTSRLGGPLIPRSDDRGPIEAGWA